MSVRVDVKSGCHRKTQQVQPDGTGREFQHLTRGDLRAERRGEVSRGHSSDEASVMGVERRAEGPGSRPQTFPCRREQFRGTSGRCNSGSHPGAGAIKAEWSSVAMVLGGASEDGSG